MSNKVCVIGGGNSAHVTAGLVASLTGWECQMYAGFADEAERLAEGITLGGIDVCYGPDDGNEVVHGAPTRVSSHAAEVVPGCRVIILCLPALAYGINMRQIAAHIDEGAWIGTICASNGFDWCVDEAMTAVGKSPELYGVFALQNLPWACRLQEFGRAVDAMGTKPFMEITARPWSRIQQISQLMEELIRVPCPPVSGGFLGMGLSNLCQVIHPAVMHGNFGSWDGQTPFDEAPLFYQGMSDEAADNMYHVSDEILAVRADLERRYKGLDMSVVRHIFPWTLRAYGKYITDTTSLRTRFSSNKAYAGLICPMGPAPGGTGLVPDFSARYLSEDIPYNLVAVRGVAELCGVATPTIDLILEWAQRVMGKEYLVDGRLLGGDLVRTFAPQRFGFSHLEQIPELASLTG